MRRAVRGRPSRPRIGATPAVPMIQLSRRWMGSWNSPQRRRRPTAPIRSLPKRSASRSSLAVRPCSPDFSRRNWPTASWGWRMPPRRFGDKCCRVASPSAKPFLCATAVRTTPRRLAPRRVLSPSAGATTAFTKLPWCGPRTMEGATVGIPPLWRQSTYAVAVGFRLQSRRPTTSPRSTSTTTSSTAAVSSLTPVRRTLICSGVSSLPSRLRGRRPPDKICPSVARHFISTVVPGRWRIYPPSYFSFVWHRTSIPSWIFKLRTRLYPGWRLPLIRRIRKTSL
mmetsp:Transcript_11456/g.27006  ORF Transcript_11456/g.27006 Transcript_11456/m.27006 type:complete len:282 (+) Transcript_11456:575-1420(+)